MCLLFLKIDKRHHHLFPIHSSNHIFLLRAPIIIFDIAFSFLTYREYEKSEKNCLEQNKCFVIIAIARKTGEKIGEGKAKANSPAVQGRGAAYPIIIVGRTGAQNTDLVFDFFILIFLIAGLYRDSLFCAFSS